MSTSPGSSKRWKHFHSALQLATQRASNKWSYEDYKACFPQYCAEEPEGSQTAMGLLARGMQLSIEQQTESMLAQYNAAEAIDTLHNCVLEAKECQKNGIVPKDAWRADLPPRTAVRARTVPVLKEERDRMRARLKELEEENLQLIAELKQQKSEQDKADEECIKLLDALDETVQAFASLQEDDLVNWTLNNLETSNHDLQ